MNKDDLPPRDIDLSRMSKNEFHEKLERAYKECKEDRTTNAEIYFAKFRSTYSF